MKEGYKKLKEGQFYKIIWENFFGNKITTFEKLIEISVCLDGDCRLSFDYHYFKPEQIISIKEIKNKADLLDLRAT